MALYDDITGWISNHPAKTGTLAGWYQQACGLLAAVVAVPLVIRMLPPEEAGLWFSFQSILAILSLTDFGFTLVLSRQVSFSMTAQGHPIDATTDFLDIRSGWEGISDIYALTRRIFRWVCAFGFLALAILYHTVLPLGKLLENPSPETAISWYVLGISCLLLVQAKPHQALLDGMARVYFTRLLSGTQLLLSGFGVVAVLMNGGRLIHMTMAVFITALLNYAAVRWGVHKVAGGHLVPPVRLNRKNLAKFARIATPLGVMSLSAFMGSSVQVPLVGFILGTAAVPAYFLAQRIGTVLNQSCLQFVFPQSPLFTQEVGARHYSEAKHRMQRTLFLTSTLIVMANIVFYVASPTVADRWVGPGRYLTGVPLLILAIDFCLMYGAMVWGSFILARGINPFMWSTLLSGLITISLCLVLGQRFGLLGIATASLVAGLCTNYWFIPFQGLQMIKTLKHPISATANQ